MIATTGGGFAVAAGLAKNSVGSAQIKKGAVKSVDVKDKTLSGKDVKDNSLTGADINELTLSTVPSVAKVQFGVKAAAALGQTVNVAARGPRPSSSAASTTVAETWALSSTSSPRPTAPPWTPT